MEPNPDQKPFVIPPPRYFGVRCACGAYLVLEEIRGNAEHARCTRPDRPAWIGCDLCGDTRQYFAKDIVKFNLPSPDDEPDAPPGSDWF